MIDVWSGTGQESLSNKNKQPPVLHENLPCVTIRFPDYAVTTKGALSQPWQKFSPLI